MLYRDEKTIISYWFLVRRLCHAGMYKGQAFVYLVSMETPGGYEDCPRSPSPPCSPTLLALISKHFSDLYLISCLMKWPYLEFHLQRFYIRFILIILNSQYFFLICLISFYLYHFR